MILDLFTVAAVGNIRSRISRLSVTTVWDEFTPPHRHTTSKLIAEAKYAQPFPFPSPPSCPPTTIEIIVLFYPPEKICKRMLRLPMDVSPRALTSLGKKP